MDIYKITANNLQGIAPKKLEKAGTTSKKFSLEQSSEVQKTSAPSGIRLEPIDALFLNLDQRRQHQHQAIAHSDQILTQLETLRLEIISGSIARQTLEMLANLLQQQTQSITEEPLRSLILEVETRAKVELAKLG